MSKSIQETLDEREKTHGDYREHAAVTQNIKEVMYTANGWHKLNSSQRETLDMIAHKIGRILTGDPNIHDHWHDISGYSTLVANQLDPK